MSFDRRLAIFLLDETAKTGIDNITMTHEQIARYVAYIALQGSDGVFPSLKPAKHALFRN